MAKTRIDKSQLRFGEPKRLIDHAYRQSFKDSVCVASRNGIDLCGLPAVGAHMNDEGCSGMGQKVSDDEIMPLCFQCHADQHQNPGASWWYHNVLKPQARRRYRAWQSKK